MVKNNCLNCSNRVGKDYCTMQKDMNAAMYRSCEGFVQVPRKQSIAERQKSYEDMLKMKRRLAMKSSEGMSDDNFTSDFLRFLKNGGSWSVPQDRRLV